MKKISTKRHQFGFTLIELLIVIAILGLLITGAFYGLDAARKKSRDTKRLASIDQVRKALELYLDDHGRYPSSDGEGPAGWDSPDDGDFIGELKAGNYLSAEITDPLPHNFRYYRYPPGYKGCDSANGGYYVLYIVELESIDGQHPTDEGWRCPERTWIGAGEWVAGKFEN